MEEVTTTSLINLFPSNLALRLNSELAIKHLIPRACLQVHTKLTVVDSALNKTGTSIFGPAFDDFVSIFTPSIGDYFGYIPADYTTGIVKELIFSNYTAP